MKTIRPYWYNTTRDDGMGFVKALLVALVILSIAAITTHYRFVV
jgi:hypothetical protein